MSVLALSDSDTSAGRKGKDLAYLQLDFLINSFTVQHLPLRKSGLFCVWAAVAQRVRSEERAPRGWQGRARGACGPAVRGWKVPGAPRAAGKLGSGTWHGEREKGPEEERREPEHQGKGKAERVQRREARGWLALSSRRAWEGPRDSQDTAGSALGSWEQPRLRPHSHRRAASQRRE